MGLDAGTAKVLGMDGEEIKPKAAEEPKPKRGKANDAEAKADEPSPLPVFDSEREAFRELVKATLAEETARDRRKQVGVRYADQMRQARDAFDLAVSESDAGPVKRACIAAANAEEAAKDARAKAKAAREKADEACQADRSKIGKRFSELSEVKDKRADAKTKASKAYSKAEEARSLVSQGIRAQAKQLHLEL